MIKRSPISVAALSVSAVLSVWLPPSITTAQRASTGAVSAPNRVVSIGRLIRSGQARNGTPRFALLDDEGTLTAYVVPATGVNLARHLNESVAITARSVSRDQDGLPYLLAQRIGAVGGGRPHSAATKGPSSTDEPRIVAESAGEDEFDGLIDPDFDPGVYADDFGNNLAWVPGIHRDDRVRPAAQYVAEEPIFRPVEEIPPLEDRVRLDTSSGPRLGCGNDNCSSCTPNGPCTDTLCPCGPAGRFWFRAEYLGWQTRGASTPPLVTTSPAGTSAQDAGVLGVDGTSVVAGGSSSGSVTRSGTRFVMGGWLDRSQRRGLEFDFYSLEDDSESFSHSSFGDPILARPFFNTQLNMQDSELIAYPGIVSGTVAVNYESEFQSFAPRYRHNLRCDNFFPLPRGGCDGFEQVSCGPVGGSRVDLTLGLRFARLHEELLISEDLISQADSSFATFNVRDAFETTNEFSGFEMGLVWDVYRNRWSMELATRFALGNNKRKVAINGETTSVMQGSVFNDVGGLLALPSNMGNYEDDEFVVIPEFSLTFGYQIAPRVRFLFGYTVIYWNNVVRPGDQIDLNVNPDFLPPILDTGGLLAPKFAMNDGNFWAQGVNLGLDWRW